MKEKNVIVNWRIRDVILLLIGFAISLFTNAIVFESLLRKHRFLAPLLTSVYYITALIILRRYRSIRWKDIGFIKKVTLRGIAFSIILAAALVFILPLLFGRFSWIGSMADCPTEGDGEPVF